MEIALYDPECGYYSLGPTIGGRGDYSTIADIDPLFGEILAGQFAEWSARAAFGGHAFDLVEVGAGSGRLAEQILAALGERFPLTADRARYWIDEISPALRAGQQGRLSVHRNVFWRRLEEVAPSFFKGVIFSNELFDALPCRRFVRRPFGWAEMLVAESDDRLVWEERQVTEAEADEWLDRLGPGVPHGGECEVPVRAAGQLRLMASRLSAGFIVTIDYGAERAELERTRSPGGTLRCFWRQQLYTNPFLRPGHHDITYSVDFTLLREVGEEMGLKTLKCERLSEFLRARGLLAHVAEALELKERNSGARSISPKHLVVPGPLTENFMVLIQRKGDV